ncbi:MAG: gamma-glutamylcyclotransferase [Pseudomonadales bacterium]|nr:gamma-glutamylcyclotransferase [Pseudomonadales bacterium]
MKAALHRVFICGSSMRGQPDHGNLPDDAFVRAARTAPRYRLHAVKDGWHPGIYEVDAGGVAIPGELYALSPVQYDFLVTTEPPDMYAAEVALDDGSTATAFLYPRALIEAAGWPDISDLGGWAAYKAKQEQGA